MYRCSRSQIGFASEDEEKDVILKKYQKYKQMSKDLIAENKELKQVIISFIKTTIFILVITYNTKNKHLFLEKYNSRPAIEFGAS